MGWRWRRLIRAASSIRSRQAGSVVEVEQEQQATSCRRWSLPACLPAHAEVVVESSAFLLSASRWHAGHELSTSGLGSEGLEKSHQRQLMICPLPFSLFTFLMRPAAAQQCLPSCKKISPSSSSCRTLSPSLRCSVRPLQLPLTLPRPDRRSTDSTFIIIWLACIKVSVVPACPLSERKADLAPLCTS
ncbi:hypothetical protein Mapa_008882 [Marchantia paleacea]|nr:hypothetical protein Mapa_008882 [Marchantia paleacea]